MAQLVGPRGCVVTFEPVPETFAALEDNIRLNALTNVWLECAAVGDRELAITLSCCAGRKLSWTPSATGYGWLGKQNSISVPAVSLDRYVQKTGVRPNLIKIDVEGTELAVLRGARQTLMEFRPVVLVEIHDQGAKHEEEVRDLLKACGYAITNLGARNREVFCVAIPCMGDSQADQVEGAAESEMGREDAAEYQTR
jgi:FkbM family methyltransferase